MDKIQNKGKQDFAEFSSQFTVKLFVNKQCCSYSVNLFEFTKIKPQRLDPRKMPITSGQFYKAAQNLTYNFNRFNS